MTGPSGVNDVWNPWRLEAIRRLWDQGVSAKQIAAALGGGLTRNAVVGKAHRMGLTGRPSPIIRDGLPRPPKPRTPKAAKEGREALLQARERSAQATVAQPPRAAVVRPAPTPPSVPPRLSNRTCAWPIGDPREPGFHFCGAGGVQVGRPYCDDHTAIAFRKATPASATTPLFDQSGARKWTR